MIKEIRNTLVLTRSELAETRSELAETRSDVSRLNRISKLTTPLFIANIGAQLFGGIEKYLGDRKNKEPRVTHPRCIT